MDRMTVELGTCAENGWWASPKQPMPCTQCTEDMWRTPLASDRHEAAAPRTPNLMPSTSQDFGMGSRVYR